MLSVARNQGVTVDPIVAAADCACAAGGGGNREASVDDVCVHGCLVVSGTLSASRRPPLCERVGVVCMPKVSAGLRKT